MAGKPWLLSLPRHSGGQPEGAFLFFWGLFLFCLCFFLLLLLFFDGGGALKLCGSRAARSERPPHTSVPT